MGGKIERNWMEEREGKLYNLIYYVGKIFSIRRYKKQKTCINKIYTGFYHEYFETLPKNLKTFQINKDIKHINR